jgi:hypothetical protein
VKANEILDVVVLTTEGRAGSLLSHVLLLNAFGVCTPETWQPSLLDLPLDRPWNLDDFRVLCEENYGSAGSLWVYDSDSIQQSLANSTEGHSQCACSRLGDSATVKILHTHNLLFDERQLRRVVDITTSLTPPVRLKFLVCTREWESDMASFIKKFPVEDTHRLVSAMSWIIRGLAVRTAGRYLEELGPVLRLPIERWHREPIQQWDSVLQFAGIQEQPFPWRPRVRGRYWNGGTDYATVVSERHLEALVAIELPAMEQYLVRTFDPDRRPNFRLRATRFLVLTASDTLAFFSLAKLSSLRRFFFTKNCNSCAMPPVRPLALYLSSFRLPCGRALRHMFHSLMIAPGVTYLRLRKSSKRRIGTDV